MLLPWSPVDTNWLTKIGLIITAVSIWSCDRATPAVSHLEASTSTGKVGVLLASHGDIDDPEKELKEYIEVSFQRNPGIPLPFWSRGPLTPPAYSLAVDNVRSQYDLIGPTQYRANAALQMAAVDQALAAKGITGKTYLGYNFARPYIEETMEQMVKDGVETIVVFNKGAQFSYASSGENMEDALKFLEKSKEKGLKVIGYREYSDDDRFRKLMAEVLERDARKTFPGISPANICLFVASHGLPTWLTDKGDPAIYQMKSAVAAIKTLIPQFPIYHGFLNDDFFPGASWVSPKALNLAPTLLKDRCKFILLDGRLSFTNHHRATLFDLNYETRNLLESPPANADRAVLESWKKPTVVLANNFDGDPGYAALIADLTLEALEGVGPVVTLKPKDGPAMPVGSIGKPGVDPFFKN